MIDLTNTPPFTFACECGGTVTSGRTVDPWVCDRGDDTCWRYRAQECTRLWRAAMDAWVPRWRDYGVDRVGAMLSARVAGKTYREIGKAFGIGPQRASELVRRRLLGFRAETPGGFLQELRIERLQTERL